MHQYTPERAELQTLGPAELQQRAHDMAARYPNRFLTPDHAYTWLRFAIEPIFWDIRMELFASGMHYVGYFGGEARCCVPITTYELRPACYTTASNLMNAWFADRYPLHLASNRWIVTHVAMYAEAN